MGRNSEEMMPGAGSLALCVSPFKHCARLDVIAFRRANVHCKPTSTSGGRENKSLANEERKWERAIGNISKAINFSHRALLRNCWQHTGDTLPHRSVRDLLHMILWDHLVSLSSVGTEIPHVGGWSHLPSAAVVAAAWELERKVKTVPVGQFGEKLSSGVGQAGHCFLLSFALCGQSWDKCWHTHQSSVPFQTAELV